MKNGSCPKCGSKEIFAKKNGITTSEKQVFVRTSLFSSASDRKTYLCVTCGYYENYITDREALEKAKKKWDRIEFLNN